MWVGSDGYDGATVVTAGILRYDLAGNYIGKFDQNNTPIPFGTGNGDFGAWSLASDSKGRMWAGMNGAKGIAVYDTNVWHYIGVPALLPVSTIFRPNSIAVSGGVAVYEDFSAQQVGASIDAIFFCPHAAIDNCDCRKPKPGMFEEIAKRFKISLKGVPTVGDSLRDLQSGFISGCAPYLVLTGKGQKTFDTGGLPPGTQVFADLASMVDALLKSGTIATAGAAHFSI